MWIADVAKFSEIVEMLRDKKPVKDFQNHHKASK
jgi:hypothetical protein